MKKLLIVEDDAIFAGLLARALGRHGFQVMTSNDFKNAEVAIREHQPDAVLLDININGDNGLNLIPLIHDVSTDTKIVVLTSFGNPRTAAWAIRQGADEYLSKQAEIAEIVSALDDDRPSVHFLPASFMTPEEARDAHILQFLTLNYGNVSQTARDLSMHRRTLQRILNRLRSVAPVQGDSKFGRARRLVNLWSRMLGRPQKTKPILKSFVMHQSEEPNMPVAKIISGEGTGVQRAALDVAVGFLISIGGNCRHEDVSVDAGSTPAVEKPSERQLIKRNILESDATLIMFDKAGIACSPGAIFAQQCTADHCRQP